jgi:hypothetical protein
MNVVTAAEAAKGRSITMPEQADPLANNPPKDPTPAKARVVKRRAHTATRKKKPTRKASEANKRATTRRGSKTARSLTC